MHYTDCKQRIQQTALPTQAQDTAAVWLKDRHGVDGERGKLCRKVCVPHICMKFEQNIDLQNHVGHRSYAGIDTPPSPPTHTH